MSSVTDVPVDTVDWRSSCRARGGVPTVDPTTGADACRIPNGTGWRYEDPQKGIIDLLGDWDQSLSETDIGQDINALGDAVRANPTDLLGAATNVVKKTVDATGLGDGATGLGAKVLGIPHWLFVLLLILALYMLAVGAGLVPPLKKLL